MRCASFGVDRYSRRYWSLPHCGGVFVEGIDSEEMENDVWWMQSQQLQVTATEFDTPVETETKSVPPLIKLPVQTDLESYSRDSHHSRRNHRLKQVRFNRYQRGTTSPSKDGSLNTHLSEDGSENEGSSSPVEGKLLSPYGRMSAYNPFPCDVTWLHSELRKDPLVARPVPVHPPLAQGLIDAVVCCLLSAFVVLSVTVCFIERVICLSVSLSLSDCLSACQYKYFQSNHYNTSMQGNLLEFNN